MKNYKFESLVINPLLSIIRKYQMDLTPPQLAKLGWMYDTLYYAGRTCWEGKCDDNAKYKIEEARPVNEEIKQLIYAAWTMHITPTDVPITFEEFNNIVYCKVPLIELELKRIKPNKTFEEWEEILLNSDVLLNSREKILSELLCVLGNEFSYKDGYIIEERNGIDIVRFGDWKNASFPLSIQKRVDKIMSNSFVQFTLEENYRIRKEEIRKMEEKRRKEQETFERLTRGVAIKPIQYKFSTYYGIRKGCSAISLFDENTHPSYIQAGIEVCENILANSCNEKENNINFANEFLNRFKK